MRIRIKSGVTRKVLLLGRYAVKFPTTYSWKLFLSGLLGNLQEAEFSKMQQDCLCPVIAKFPGGFFIIMHRAEPLSLEEWEKFSHEDFFPDRDLGSLVERKRCSFGKLDGRIVCVDYGS